MENREELSFYSENFTKPQPELLSELERKTHLELACPQMLSGAYQGRLLKLLVQLTQAERILEIGMFTGFSALAMAEGTSSKGTVTCLEVSEEFAKFAQKFFDRSPDGHKIKVRLGSASETLATLEGPYDLVFIDADKENYGLYYEAVVTLLRPGGVILVDNSFWGGKVLAPDDDDSRAIVALNQRVMNDPRVENVFLPVRDGLNVIRVK